MANKVNDGKVKVTNDHCFLCCVQIEKCGPVEDPHEISFILTHILEVPQLDNYLERVSAQRISYCSKCSTKISKIRNVLEELEKLEKVLLDEKYEIELQFRKDSHVGPEQGSVGEIRNDIVTDMKSSAIFSMLDKLKAKEIGRRSRPRTSIRIMSDVPLERVDSATTAIPEVKVDLPPPTVPNVAIASSSRTDNQRSSTRIRSRSWSQQIQQPDDMAAATGRSISRYPESTRTRNRKQSLQFLKSSFDFIPPDFVKVEEGEASNQFNIAFEPDNPEDPDEDVDPEFHPVLLTHCVIDDEDEEEIEGEGHPENEEEEGIEGEGHQENEEDDTISIKLENYDEVQVTMGDGDHPQNMFHVNGEFIDLTEDDDETYQEYVPGHEGTLSPENNATAFMCWKCGAYFDDFDLLNEHDELIHPSIPETDPECRPSKRTINRMRQTDMVNKKMNIGNLRTQKPESSSSASSSASTSHSSRITCNDCGKTFVNKICLRNHIRHMHLGIFNFRCPVCELGCRTRAELRLHLESHSDMRNHNCHVCQKSFKQKKNLVAHLKLHNTGPDFTCNLCGEQFWYVREFRRHALTHKAAQSSKGQGTSLPGTKSRLKFHDPRLKYISNR